MFIGVWGDVEGGRQRQTTFSVENGHSHGYRVEIYGGTLLKHWEIWVIRLLVLRYSMIPSWCQSCIEPTSLFPLLLRSRVFILLTRLPEQLEVRWTSTIWQLIPSMATARPFYWKWKVCSMGYFKIWLQQDLLNLRSVARVQLTLWSLEHNISIRVVHWDRVLSWFATSQCRPVGLTHWRSYPRSVNRRIDADLCRSFWPRVWPG